METMTSTIEFRPARIIVIADQTGPSRTGCRQTLERGEDGHQ